MRSFPAAVLALCALLVLSSVGVVAAAPSTGPTTTSDRTASVVATPNQLESADPKQVIRITVSADGDARWTIESHYRLETDEEAEHFEEYADAVTSGERDGDLQGGYDISLIESGLEQAEDSTEREMSLDDEGWDEPRIESGEEFDVGVIAYSFSWASFASVGENRLHLGDVFWTDDDETWFPVLNDGQQLVIEPPEGYGFENPPVGTQNGALVWDGPYVFGEGELEVTFLEGAGAGISTGWLSGLSTVATGLGVLVLVLVVGSGGYLLATRYPPSTLFGTDDAEEATELKYADEPGENRSTESASGREDAREDADVRPPSEEVDVDLLSDEERVLRLLRQNGGRMKQAMIVEETGWSNAKVSQLLSKMDDDGEIEKLRIGRENLITLPEIDPTEIE